MFRKPKHVYTCPDVMHNQAVAKKNGRILLGAYAALYGGAFVMLKIQERKENRKPNLTIVPD